MEKTIFEKIIDREIPANIIYENDWVLGFKDINPVAPKHYLLIPKLKIMHFHDLPSDNHELLAAITQGIQDIANERNMIEEGYRVVTNIGEYGGQTVYHLHFHIIGGRELSWRILAIILLRFILICELFSLRNLLNFP